MIGISSWHFCLSITSTSTNFNSMSIPSATTTTQTLCSFNLNNLPPPYPKKKISTHRCTTGIKSNRTRRLTITKNWLLTPTKLSEVRKLNFLLIPLSNSSNKWQENSTITVRPIRKNCPNFGLPQGISGLFIKKLQWITLRWCWLPSRNSTRVWLKTNKKYKTSLKSVERLQIQTIFDIIWHFCSLFLQPTPSNQYHLEYWWLFKIINFKLFQSYHLVAPEQHKIINPWSSIQEATWGKARLFSFYRCYLLKTTASVLLVWGKRLFPTRMRTKRCLSVLLLFFLNDSI